MLTIPTTALPAPLQITHEGRQEILVPVLLRITVDPLDGFLEEESIQVALDRLADLPLEVYLGRVPLPVHAHVALHKD